MAATTGTADDAAEEWGNVTCEFDPFVQIDGSYEFAQRLEKKLQRIRLGASAAAVARRQRKAASDKASFRGLYKQMISANTLTDRNASGATSAAYKQGSMLVTPSLEHSPAASAPDAQGLEHDADEDSSLHFAPDGMSLIFAEAALSGPGAWQDALEWEAGLLPPEASFQPLVPDLPYAALEGGGEAFHSTSLPPHGFPQVVAEDDDLLTGGNMPSAGWTHGQCTAATAAGSDGSHPQRTQAQEGTTQAFVCGSIPWKLEPPPLTSGALGASASSSESDDEET